MDNNITYKIAVVEDYPAILVLYNKMYKTDRSLEDFKWLIEENPAGKAVLFIALMGENVVGMQSLIPYVFVKDGESVFTFKSEDTLVDKNLRGKGIFSKLYEMVHAHSDETLVWGLTDKKEILERVGMPSSERLTIGISVKRPMLISDKKGIHRFVAKTLYYSYLYLKSSFRSRRGKTVLKQKEIDSKAYDDRRLKDFFAVLSKQSPDIYFPQMNLEYLNWRFSENPNLEQYKIVVSYDENGSIGICSAIGIHGNSAYWQSFYSLSEISEDEKIGHIIGLRDKLFAAGINLIHTWWFECNAEVKAVKAIFCQAGFSKVRDGLWIVHNSTDKVINVHDLYFSPQLGIR